jgi:hypothetical protein
MNTTLRLYFPSIIFNDAIPRLTPLRTSCSSGINPRDGLIGNKLEVIECRSRGDLYKLV